jgi:hypothetical protein
VRGGKLGQPLLVAKPRAAIRFHHGSAAVPAGRCAARGRARRE